MTTNSKKFEGFTPGPWKTNTDSDGRHLAIPILADRDSMNDSDEYHPLIAQALHGGDRAPRKVAEANARLIAAAPEMLRLLKQALRRNLRQRKPRS